MAGHDVVDDPDGVRAAIGVTGQFSAVDELLTGMENMRLMADLNHLGRAAGRERVDELLDRFGLADAAAQAGVDLLGRHAPPARPGHDARRLARGDLPRRAHHRARPARAAARCGTASASSSPAGSRSSSPPSTSTRPTSSPIGSPSSTTAGSSPKAPRTSSSGASPAATSACSSPTPSALRAAADLLDGAAGDEEELVVQVPTDGTVASLRHLLGQLDDAGIEVEQLSIHTPDLDDVFFAVTGHARPRRRSPCHDDDRPTPSATRPR